MKKSTLIGKAFWAISTGRCETLRTWRYVRFRE